MTTKNKDSLIGYDPLAWMNEVSEGAGDSPDDVPPADVSESIPAQVPISPDTSEQAVNTATDNEELMTEPMSESQSDPVLNVAQSDSSKISLDANLNIQNVAQMQEQLMSALQGNELIEIDASAVNAVDTASMQLFVVLKQEAINNNKNVIFDFPSDRFIEAAQLLGVADMLAVDQTAAGFF
jgi:ABC-type transporter Mla MlaB component